MSSLATIPLSEVNDIKSGSTTVNKIMVGSNKIWPKFPFYMLDNGEYYEVTGISNNEYVRTSTNVECVLVKTSSAFDTEILMDSEVQYNLEICLTHLDDIIIFTFGGGDTYRDYEFFWNSYQTSLYFDYMSSNNSGTSFNRLSVSIGTVLKNNQTDVIYKAEALVEPGNGYYTKRIRLTNLNTSTQICNTTITAFKPSSNDYNQSGKNRHIGIGLQSNDPSQYSSTFYYVKLFDINKKVLGFYHFKEKDGKYVLYDEITKKYLNYFVNNGVEKDFSEYDIVYSDKTISVSPQTPDDYYIIDGTLTQNGITYEKLVNSVNSNLIMSGLEV